MYTFSIVRLLLLNFHLLHQHWLVKQSNPEKPEVIHFIKHKTQKIFWPFSSLNYPDLLHVANFQVWIEMQCTYWYLCFYTVFHQSLIKFPTGFL